MAVEDRVVVDPHQNPEHREQRLDQLTRLLVVAMTLVVMVNGLPFWARRVGVIDQRTYDQDLAQFCRPPVQRWWLPASCSPVRVVETGGLQRRQRIQTFRLYRITPWEVGLKALRYALMPVVLALSILLVCRGWQVMPPLPALVPLVPLILSTLTSAAISWPVDGPVSTLLNGVWSLWIPLAAVGGWLGAPRRLRILADGASALVLLQLPFLAAEAMRGLPMPFGGTPSVWLPTRLSGVLNQPNTFGGVLAISVALCVAASPRRWQRWPLLLVSLLMAILARSGTGVVGLVVVAVGLVHRQIPRRWRSMAMATSLLVVVLALPHLLGRPQLLDSPSGRLRTLQVWIRQPQTLRERWLGVGLASHNRRDGGAPALTAASGAGEVEAHPARRGPSADAQPLLLLSQGGVVALLAFYGFAIWCWWLDPSLRLVWAVLLITSLTLNVTEVFPLGLWLSVLSSRALSLRPGGPRG
ncbi:MAG: hypothetical protein VKN83_04500 [Cyanobacteriota bacterium]|nr:hypothetical protein [Cyanobacteriota bacterium]